jgi:hypothetical protein
MSCWFTNSISFNMDDILELTLFFIFILIQSLSIEVHGCLETKVYILIFFLDFPVFSAETGLRQGFGPFCTMLTLITQLWLQVTQVMRGTCTAYNT